MKIMFTSVGRRVELIQSFRNAASHLKIQLEIYGVDASNESPALAFCDEKALVPRINSQNYLPVLKQICNEKQIDVLIPTIDTDLLLLAEHQYEFGKTCVLISSANSVHICRDKRRTSDFFGSIGLKAPQTVDNYLLYKYGFPAFIKPKDGSSSVNAYKVKDETELADYASKIPNYIIQRFIEGTEYTVDIFCDFDGKPILITPRIRIAVRAGEVLKTKIVQDDTIIRESIQIVKELRPVGPITVQLIREKTTGNDYFIEINPRFGGGAPLSMKAGADSAEMLLRLFSGESLEYIDYAAGDGAVFCRYDQSIRIS